MKKLLILTLFIISFIIAKAQTVPVVKKSNLQQTIPIFAPLKAISKISSDRLPKEKDLAVSDLQIQKNISTGLYTISCKISNVGNGNINIQPLNYIKCNNKPDVTPMEGYLVQCKIEPENCSLSPCGFNTNQSLFLYKLDGNPLTSYSSDDDKTLKAGQSFIAKTSGQTYINWSKPDTCSSQRIEVILTLDPINRIGDQDLSNNVLKVYFPVQN